MTKPFKSEMGSNQTIKNYILAIQSLKIISGEEQCVDNTLSNVEISCCNKKRSGGIPIFGIPPLL